MVSELRWKLIYYILCEGEMNKSLIIRSIIIAGVASAAPGVMATSNGFDARQSAMGGVGVASAKFGAAPLINPALLAKSAPGEKISLIAPTLGAQASDSGHLIDSFDEVKSAWDELENTIGTSDVQAAAGNLEKVVSDITGKHAGVNLSLAMVLAVPNESVPVALMMNTWGQGIAHAMVNQSDLDYLEGISNGSIIPDKDDLDNLTSRAEGMAALITEYGVSLANSFKVGNVPVGVGVTPKIQRIETWNYNVAINNYESSDLRDGNWQRQTLSANIDTGLYADLSPSWTVALSAQNLFENRVKSREVNGTQTAFVIRPQVAAGTAWVNGPITFSTDIDLTPVSGFETVDKRQYAAVGAELSAASWAEVRAGYRVDMRGNDHSVFTAGLGLSPTDSVQFDLAAMAGRMRTIGGVAQFTFYF
jgi:hypothetical protein